MPKYLNVYELDRHYGGPEEGGWWFTSYTPVAIVVIPEEWGSYYYWEDDSDEGTWSPYADKDAEVEALVEKLERAFPSNGKSGSVLYRGGDYTIRYEIKPPVFEPEEVPHYC